MTSHAMISGHRSTLRPQLLLSEPQKRILWHLRTAGPTSRVQLAEAMGMNGATMTRVTQQLATLGLVEELAGNANAGRGRPMIPLAISGQGGWSAGATLHPGWLESSSWISRGRRCCATPSLSPKPTRSCSRACSTPGCALWWRSTVLCAASFSGWG
jgi:hypothetical protein